MKKKGYTLLELLVSIAITSIIALCLAAIVAVGLKVNASSFKDELDFKESTIAMMYVENVVRKAYKIEVSNDSNPQSNLIAYVKTPDDKSVISYSFKSVVTDNKNYLCAKVNNYQGGDGSGTFRIARCDDFLIYYDDVADTVKIVINENNPNLKLETKIYLGPRL